MSRGTELYGIVEEYAALGIHRTGTPVDWSTAEWMADHLTRRGLDVAFDHYDFDQWTADSTLTVDDRPVDHLAVPYEFTGRVTTSAPAIVSIDPMAGGFPEVLASPTAAARAGGADAVVIATEHPNGSLVAVNRVPGAGSGFPTVLIAGRDLATVTAADRIGLELEARTSTGRTATVIATNGLAGPPLVVSTPLTGWFRCAGERATGIAVLIDLVSRVTDVPLMVVATTGHEIGQIGVERWVAAAAGSDPRGIVHLGASIGVEEHDGPSRRLATTRLAMTNLDSTVAGPVAEGLQPARLDLAADTESWIGEAQTFSTLAVPLLSLSGAGTDFHTPEDTPERATSPESMAVAADAVTNAVTQFVRTLGATP
ncbi:MAG: hypothetical protein ACR2QE_01750 [Acidimicrobiales bacterium]